MNKSRNKARKAKHIRIRKKVLGTNEVPRLVLHKSHQNFEAQLVNDLESKTIAYATTKQIDGYGGNIEAAKKVAKVMAEKIKSLKIERIKFDRSGYIYHGKVKAFAEVIREEGVKF
ncbi:MAG: 50S ribosomal protein L18 [Mycoplasma sp.]|nr:50S ribosomal protein L18 [Mycoplasma sp.]